VAGVNADDEVLLYPTAGGDPRPVPGSAKADSPLAISDDGRFMFVSPVDDRSQILRIELARGTREPWRRVGLADQRNPGAYINNVITNGTGTVYAYTYRDDTSTLYLAEGLR
jgi:hypothetical protein